MELTVEQIAEHLRKIRSEQGEETYRLALRGFTKNLLLQGKAGSFIQDLLQKLEDNLDLEELKAEAEKMRQQQEEVEEVTKTATGGRDPSQVMVEMMRQQIPNLKTQAQFDHVMKLFEGLHFYLNAAFGQNEAVLKKSREALNKGLDLAVQLGVMAEQAAESPEIPTNPDFVNTPKEFTEIQTQQQLLKEVAALDSAERLNQWYLEQKSAMDGIVSTKLRNELFDAIRQRKKDLAN